VPDFYLSLAEEPGDFALAGLPGDRQSTEPYMFYQTVHGRPLLSGHISRISSADLAFMSSVPLVDGMYETGTINTGLPDLSRQLSLLSDAGFRYLIIHKTKASAEELAAWRTYLVASPRYEDDEVIVYSTAPVVGQDCSLRHQLGAGMGMIDVALSTETISPDALLEISVIWGTTDSPETDFQVGVALVDGEGQAGQVQRFDISPEWTTRDWPAHTILREQYSVQIEPWLEGGSHTVEMGLRRAEDGEAAGQRVQVGTVVMAAPERSFTVPELAGELGVPFSDQLWLLGYDLEVHDDSASVTLYWQAMRRMDVAFKFFVHLYGLGNETPLAQVDMMPHNWTYPTLWWEAGEVVSDEFVLQLEGLPGGSYQLAVGVYDPDTNVRLPVVGPPAELSVRDERLFLPETIER
jgi:hypothetical protein